MSQAVMQEVNMDVFARRIAPYFSWLESRIESGWTQSEHITKDVLKETKMLSTNMRARFILGVAKDEFIQEVQRALELFELAADAFPDECDEIESKSESLVKGIAEELGPQFLPGQTSVVIEKPRVQVPKVEEVVKVEKAVEPVQKVEKLEKTKAPKIERPKVEKVEPEVKKVVVKKQVKKAKPKIEKTPKVAKPVPKVEKSKFKMPKIRMPELPSIPKVKFPKVSVPKISKKSVRNFGPVKWVREFIFGED